MSDLTTRRKKELKSVAQHSWETSAVPGRDAPRQEPAPPFWTCETKGRTSAPAGRPDEPTATPGDSFSTATTDRRLAARAHNVYSSSSGRPERRDVNVSYGVCASVVSFNPHAGARAAPTTAAPPSVLL
ncbi:hypothetical protein EVAR_25230_1 [Eumeta japonica]|uniref:Uncharacterized protein n=1 Tax=Eumeta variegata TaxID=151549 RepID=A0A4C1WHJ3_EUMVA|nr:hypothetical protein EVAR_25230_1 [Eumeta japonica]